MAKTKITAEEFNAAMDEIEKGSSLQAVNSKYGRSPLAYKNFSRSRKIYSDRYLSIVTDEPKSNTGRPSVYHDGIPQMMLDYFSGSEDPYYVHFSDKGTAQLLPRKYPTFVDFCRINNIPIDTFNEWSTTIRGFSQAIARCKAFQEAFIVQQGLSGAGNSNFAQFLLKAKHGYSEQQQIEQDGDVVITVRRVAGNKDEDE